MGEYNVKETEKYDSHILIVRTKRTGGAPMDKNIKTGIIASLIATIFFIYFLHPILNLVSKFVIFLISLAYYGYLDRLYSEAALGFVTDPNMLIGLWCIAILVLVLISITVIRLVPDKSSRRLIAISCLVLITFIPAVATSTCIFKFKLEKSFQAHMRFLGPILSADAERQLWRDWASIRSKKDYDEVYRCLNNIAIKGGVKLDELPVSVPF